MSSNNLAIRTSKSWYLFTLQQNCSMNIVVDTLSHSYCFSHVVIVSLSCSTESTDAGATISVLALDSIVQSPSAKVMQLQLGHPTAATSTSISTSSSLFVSQPYAALWLTSSLFSHSIHSYLTISKCTPSLNADPGLHH